MDGLILLLYALTFSGIIVYTSRLDFRELRFADGIFIGLLFFIFIPLLIAFVDGEIASIDMRAGPFRPFRDTGTSLQLCIGCATVILFHWVSRLSGRRRVVLPAAPVPARRAVPSGSGNALRNTHQQIAEPGPLGHGEEHALRSGDLRLHHGRARSLGRAARPIVKSVKQRLHDGPRVLLLFVAAYMVCNIYSFVSSGKLDGGHWQGNLETSLQSNMVLIIIGNFANVYRGAIFGILYNAFGRGLVTRRTVVLVGLLVVVFDVVTTFNRITAAYYAIMLVLLYRRHLPLMLLAAIPLLPVVGYFSIVWSALRGLALVDGYSLTGFLNAMTAVNTAIGSGQIEIGRSTNGIFDSENIIVFDWLVDNTGGRFPQLYGYTFFLRPLTVLIPSTFWPEKPGVFGVMVGSNLQGISGLALNSTLFGEAFGNFSYAWPLPLFGMLLQLNVLYAAFARRFPFANGAGFFVGFALWRFDMAFGFISLVGLVAFVIVLTMVDIVLDSRAAGARGLAPRRITRSQRRGRLAVQPAFATPAFAVGASGAVGEEVWRGARSAHGVQTGGDAWHG